MSEPLLIKKYANRRLYDTGRSHYITVAELAEIVKGGQRVKVVDAKTGADLTRQVLIQVLLEEQERVDLLPVELLHHIIAVQGTIQAAPFARWLADSFSQWQKLGDMMSGTVPGFDGMAAMWRRMAGMPGTGGASGRGGPTEATSSQGAPPRTEPPPASKAEPASETPPADDPLAGLRAQMDDLLGKLGG